MSKPKKDECSVCTGFNAIVEKTDSQILEQQRHIRNKEITRGMKSKLKIKAKSNERVITASFNLKLVLMCPHGNTGPFYYSRRLKNHSLNLLEINNMKTFSFLWNENEAMKGSCEIATAVTEFLLVKSNDSAKIIYFFCDWCGGQNKNQMINVMLPSSLVEFNLGKIELITLCSGHSQNENNTAHLVIKRQSRS